MTTTLSRLAENTTTRPYATKTLCADAGSTLLIIPVGDPRNRRLFSCNPRSRLSAAIRSLVGGYALLAERENNG
jgi:hypothetical protein